MSAQAFSIEAEQSLLGALMFDARAFERIEIDLQPTHFYRDEHRKIFQTIRSLLDAGRPADSLAVSDALDHAGELEHIGGMSAVVELEQGVASAAGIKRHAEIVVERAMHRALIAAADEIVAVSEQPGMAVRDRIESAQKAIMALSDSATLGARDPQRIADMLPNYLSMVAQRWEKRGGGITTGFPDLDKRLGGGLAEGALVVIAGRPAMGKTSIALQIAYHAAEHGFPSLVCSQEMQGEQLIDRVVSFSGRVPLTSILTGEGMMDEDHDRFAAAIGKAREIPLDLDEQGALRPADVRRKARKVKSRGGLAVLVIDYLQLMVGDSTGENRTRELTQITGELKALAKELKICVVALSQLNRQLEARPNKRPVMSDLRESGSIEQDADVILAAYRDEYYNEDSPDKGLAELLVLKNRQGASGGFVPLVFHGEYTRFDSMFGDWPSRQQGKPAQRKRGRFDD